MILTKDNYFSREANEKYMSVSQYKTFSECEARAMAELRGEYERPKTVSLLVGSYVDAYFEGTLDKFIADNPEIFTQKGELKSDFKHAEYIISRIERDKFFMKYISGDKQVIKTGEIDGIPWKTKIDSYHDGKAIVDLKIVKDFKPIYKEGEGRMSFIEAWGYDIQGAVYQRIEGNNLPFFIAAATKEPEPDLAVIRIPQEMLEVALHITRGNVRRFHELKQGISEPIRCEKCDYCKKTKVLTRVIGMEELQDD